MTQCVRLLKLEEVKSRTGLGRSNIYAKIKNNTFPPSISLSTRSCAWIESEIDAWIASRISATRCEQQGA